MARKRTMTKEQAKKRASEMSMKWDNEHNLIPIKINTSPENDKKFLAICEKYHISRREVMNELMKEFINGDIELEVEQKVAIPLKVDHDLYNKLPAKEQGLSKAKAFSAMLDNFLKDPVSTLNRTGIDVENRAEELINALKDVQAKHPDHSLYTSDVNNYQDYALCFGTWATALYVCGSFGYKQFIDYRKRSTAALKQKELKWILKRRKEELAEQNLPLNEETFPYPGLDLYGDAL